MTGEKNSRWTELRKAPVVMYMSGAFRSALVPVANLQKVFGRPSYTAQRLAEGRDGGWASREHPSNWVRRRGGQAAFVTLQPRRGELLRQCARTFAAEGKWDHLAILGSVAPMVLLHDDQKEGEIDPSIYVMY